jgi:hypothetical protein
MGAEVPGSNPRASPPWIDLLYHMVYIMVLARDFWCNIYGITYIYDIVLNKYFGRTMF